MHLFYSFVFPLFSVNNNNNWPRERIFHLSVHPKKNWNETKRYKTIFHSCVQNLLFIRSSYLFIHFENGILSFRLNRFLLLLFIHFFLLFYFHCCTHFSSLFPILFRCLIFYQCDARLNIGYLPNAHKYIFNAMAMHWRYRHAKTTNMMHCSKEYINWSVKKPSY